MKTIQKISLPLRGPIDSFTYLEKYVNFDKNDIVLEIGLGDGHTTWSNSKKVKMIYGFDISKPLIKFLRNKIRGQNIHLECIDVTRTKDNKLQKYSNYFDQVYSIETLHHVYDTQSFFDTLHNLLKPGGYAFIVFHNLIDYGVSHFESRSEIIQQLSNSKLSLVEMKKIERTRWLMILHTCLISPVVFMSRKLFGSHHDNSHKSSVRFAKPDGKMFYQSQQFDGTHAFGLMKSDPWYRILSNLYFDVVWSISKGWRRYHYTEPEDFGVLLREYKAQLLALVIRKESN